MTLMQFKLGGLEFEFPATRLGMEVQLEYLKLCAEKCREETEAIAKRVGVLADAARARAKVDEDLQTELEEIRERLENLAKQ